MAAEKKRVHIDCKAVVAVHSTGWRRAIADIANHIGTVYLGRYLRKAPKRSSHTCGEIQQGKV